MENEAIEEQVEEVVEESTKPETVPLSALDEQRRKKREAEERAEEAERRYQALQQERDLLLLGAGGKQEEDEELPMPHPDDFIDTAEWTQKMKEWNEANKQRLLKETEKKSLELLEQREQERLKTEQQREYEARRESVRKDYLTRAERLNADDFLDVDERLRQQLSPELYEAVIGTELENSEAVAYQLGSNDAALARELAEEFDSAPNKFQAGIRLAKRLLDLSQKSTGAKREIPEPDEPIRGGAGRVSSYEAELDALREKVTAGKMKMEELVKWKKENRDRA